MIRCRVEDHRLLTGAGHFIADLVAPGGVHAVVLRAPHAHAEILDIATKEALASQGVLAVLTGRDLIDAGLGGIPWEVPVPGHLDAEEGDPAVASPQSLLAVERVRYVGEPVAFVVAETLAQARDAVELVTVVYRALPSVITPMEALAEDAPRLHASNLCFQFSHGDPALTDATFAEAAHVVRLRAINQRLVAAPIETRGYTGVWDGARHTLHAAAGKPHPIRHTLARFVFGIPEQDIRVLVGDIGGGFGAKNVLYAEAALVLWAARLVGRPVRWQADRTESFLSDMQGRDHTSDAQMAFDAEGRAVAIRVRTLANLGAWLGPRAVNPAIVGAKTLCGAYRIPVGHIAVQGVFTNTVPTCPYRGAGAPEIMFLIERLMDLGARALGIGADEIRRRNLIPPEAMPLRTIGGVTYADCDFPAVMDMALARADWAGFPARHANSVAAGKLRGIGMSVALEAYGTSLGEQAKLILEDGRAELHIGTQSSGQSHATVYAMLIAERLGIASSDVVVIQGDTDRVAQGNGTGASRSLTVGGSAVTLACAAIIETGKDVAGQMLEAALPDLVFRDGRYEIAGTDRSVSLMQVAERAGGLAACEFFRATADNFPYGCHVAEVEIDPETGMVRLLRHVAVQDSGNVASRMVVEGQMQGGIAQGVGQALMEFCAYDGEQGQVLSASLMDYALPRAEDLPSFDIALHAVPSRSNPLGAKAVGEAGPTAAPPAIINAICHAIGVAHIEMPATSERIWRALNPPRQH